MPKGTESTTKFKADISQLKAAMQEASRAVRLANSEFKAATGGMDDWAKSADGLSAKTKQLKSVLAAQNTQLSSLEKQYELTAKEQGENSKGAQELAIKINNQRAAIASTEAELDKYEKAMDDVGKETEEAGDAAEQAANGGFTILKGAMANLVAQGISAAINGMKELGSTMIDVGKQAIASYADYEQLVGGVETLFGQNGQTLEEYAKSVGKTAAQAAAEYGKLGYAQEVVMQKASNAYKTAGMSANEYMENVTSFSASLISSLDGNTFAAAKAADQAIVDMADNANKMGTSLDSITSAYQGFSKGQYTLLDNLKLGYGGTKTEMERLLQDAQKISGVEYNIDNLSDVYEAIHVIQTEMGITGTTAREASETIAGSTAAMKAAWSNLLTGIADDNADFDQLMTNLIDSVMTVLKNLVPRVKTVIKGVSKLVIGLVEEFLPIIIDLINTELPNIIQAGGQLLMALVTGLVEALPELTATFLDIITMIVDGLADAVPQVLNLIAQMIPQIVNVMVSKGPQILQAAVKLFMGIIKAIPVIVKDLVAELPSIIKTITDTLIGALPIILEAAITLMTEIINAIPVIIDALGENLPTIIDTISKALIDALPLILKAAIDLLMMIVKSIPTIITSLQNNLPKIINQIVKSLIEALPQVLEASVKLLMALIDALPTIIEALVVNLPRLVTTITKTLVDNLPLVIKASVTLLMGLIKAIPDIIVELGKNLPTIISSIVSGLTEGISDITSVGKDLIRGLWNGISDMAGWIKSKIQGFGGDILEDLKDFFEIGSPSRLFRDEIGKWLPPGIANGFDEAMPSAIKSMTASAKEMAQDIVNEMSTPLEDMSVSLGDAKSIPSLSRAGEAGANSISNTKAQTINFNQVINSPEPVNRLTVFRDTNSLLFSAGVKLNNV